MPGESTLVVNADSGKYDVQGTVTLGQGVIRVSFTADSPSHQVNQTIATVGTGVDLYNALSGQVESRRIGSGRASVAMVGMTPLSDLALAEEPATAWLDIGLAWDFTFWCDALSPDKPFPSLKCER